MMSATAHRTLAGSDKSHTTDTARWPFFSMVFCTSLSFALSRPTKTTMPCLANSNAVARPMPEVGPVTTYAFAIQRDGVRHVHLRGRVCRPDFSDELCFGAGIGWGADPARGFWSSSLH